MANNYTKKMFQRKSDNVTVALGTLVAPNALQVEVWDKEKKGLALKVYDLTGEVVETERNEVLVIAKPTSETGLEVLKMVEVPEGKTPLKSFNFSKGLEEPIGIYSSCNFKGADDKVSQGGSQYKGVKFSGGDNTTVILNSFYFTQLDEGERYIFVTNGKFDKNTKAFKMERGDDAGKEVEWTTHRGFALCQLV